MGSKAALLCLKKNQNAPRPSEYPPVRGVKMSKRLGGIKGCKYKTSSWHLNEFPDGNNIGSTEYNVGEKLTVMLYTTTVLSTSYIMLNCKVAVMVQKVCSVYRTTVCMYGHTYSKSMDQPGKVASPARGQLNRENEDFPVRVRV